MASRALLAISSLGCTCATVKSAPPATTRYYSELSPIRTLLNGESESEWLNFGLWPQDHDVGYRSAAEALADAVSTAAGIREGEEVLEAGGGRGDNALRLLRHFRVSRIIGINFSVRETEAAQRRIKAAGLLDRTSLLTGDAAYSAQQLPASSVDRVVAVDCAYHFETRRRFLRSSARLLKPGGGIALADVVLAPGIAVAGIFGAFTRFVAYFCGIPTENLVSAEGLESDLRASAFVGIEIEDVTDRVFGRFSAHVQSEADKQFGLRRWVALILSFTVSAIAASGLFRYVIARGSRGQSDI